MAMGHKEKTHKLHALVDFFFFLWYVCFGRQAYIISKKNVFSLAF